MQEIIQNTVKGRTFVKISNFIYKNMKVPELTKAGYYNNLLCEVVND